jgi:hypothetical protein
MRFGVETILAERETGKMSTKTKEQKRARAIQKQTGWSYSECLRLANEHITEEGLEILITLRKSAKGANELDKKLRRVMGPPPPGTRFG